MSGMAGIPAGRYGHCHLPVDGTLCIELPLSRTAFLSGRAFRPLHDFERRNSEASALDDISRTALSMK
jgi:hypothetical protein